MNDFKDFTIKPFPFALGADESVKKGLIILPDISGFTRFVHTTNFKEGKSIISELLLSILEHNSLGLKVSEIEGDAILFYKMGIPPAPAIILEQFEYMLAGFYQKLAEFEAYFQRPFDLSLKFIAHYGEIATYKIGSFEKLYGEAVIEAHRLLKNSITSQTYALLTDDLLSAAGLAGEELQPRMKGSKLCEVYGDLRNICFSYFDYSHYQQPDLKMLA